MTNVARFAQQEGLEVFYQPIEQNYNTAEDEGWFAHSETWPQDPARAVAVVRRLCELKKQGLPIANSFQQLELMVPYFLDPAASRVAIQSHTAHESQSICAATTNLQIQANGDVRPCASKPAIGNISRESIREIWEARPRWWQSGCCLAERMHALG